jgi:RNA polymerase sigma factor (sigma-70 family)
MTPDSELLRRYTETGCEDSFAELVRRHVGLVYWAAARQCNGDTSLAQDIAQSVFTDLARKAAALSRRRVLTGWLYTSAHFAAAKAVRTERRRHTHEKEAHAMDGLHRSSSADLDWERIRPAVDTAMHQLKASDRDLILMRYFENRPWAEVGENLGLSDDATRKRVARALDRLRAFLAKRGITNTASLAAVLSANAVQIVPAGLAGTLTVAALASAASGSGSALALLGLIASAKVKVAIAGALLFTGVATPLVIRNRVQARLVQRDNSLQLEKAQMAELLAENQRLSNLVAQIAVPRTDGQMLELLRLRGEVGVLRRQLAEAAKARAKYAPSTSPSEIERYYHAHEDDFREKESVEVSMIVLNKPPTNELSAVEDLRAQASAIRARLAAGADFATEAKLYSGGSQARFGGQWGWMERGMLRSELDEVAFSLQPGEISNVIESPEVFWIMRVTGRRPPRLKPLSEVQDEIWKTLARQQRELEAQR